jgi:hypothetical protein
MIIDSTKLIEHEAGDIVDLQIYQPAKDSMEIVTIGGKFDGVKVSPNFSLESTSIVFKVKVDTVDDKKKINACRLMSTGLVDGATREELTIKFADLADAEIQNIDIKYLGLITMPRKDGVEQYEAYLIPHDNNGELGVSVGCVGNCERPDTN